MEKTIKYNFAFHAVGIQGRENLRFSIKFELFYSGSEVSVAHSNLLQPHNFPFLSCGPRGGPHDPTGEPLVYDTGLQVMTSVLFI